MSYNYHHHQHQQDYFCDQITKLLLGPQQNVNSECQIIIKPGEERRKRKVLRPCRQTVSDGAEITMINAYNTMENKTRKMYSMGLNTK